VALAYPALGLVQAAARIISRLSLAHLHTYILALAGLHDVHVRVPRPASDPLVWGTGGVGLTRECGGGCATRRVPMTSFFG
jgi:hypothetical protein